MRLGFRRHLSSHDDLYAILLILVICALFLAPYLFTRPTPLIFPVSSLGTDLNRDVLPNIEYIVNILKSGGELPLWRNYLLSGAPLVGHPSLPLFYPPNWLLLVMPIPLALNLLAWLAFAWMGTGMYAYLRISANLSPIPALFGGIAMALSPKWVAHLSGGHWFMLAALAWIPWALLAMERFWKTHKISWIFLLATALASQAMNHLPVFVICGLSLLIWSCMYFSRQGWWTWLKSMVTGWGIAILFTGGLAAAQILPFVPLFSYGTHSVDSSTFTSLNPAALLVALFPPEFKYPEWFLFPGLVVLIFAGVSWSYGWGRFEKIWAALGAFGLVLSLGEFTPLYSWLFGWNPLISVLRVPTRWWVLTLLTLSVLAAVGFGRWIEKGQQLNKKGKTFIAILIGIELIAGGMKVLLGENFPFAVLPIAGVAAFLAVSLALAPGRNKAVFQGFILGGLCLELILVGSSLICPQIAIDSGIPTQVLAQVEAGLAKGTRIYSPGEGFPALALERNGWDSAEGYDALPSGAYLKFIRLATGCPLVQEATGSDEEKAACLNPADFRPDWLQLLDVGLVAVHGEMGWQLQTLPESLGRVFSFSRVSDTSPQTCLNDLQNVNVLSTALVEEPATIEKGGELMVTGQDRQVNEETFQVTINTEKTLLVRSENWAPGWTAKVDGIPAPLLKVDCVLQGVWVQPGRHTVVFEYVPFGYPLGCWISLTTLILMALILLTQFLLKFKVISIPSEYCNEKIWLFGYSRENIDRWGTLTGLVQQHPLYILQSGKLWKAKIYC